VAVGFGLKRGGGESPGSACGPMTMTPSGAIYLVESVILLPLFLPLQLAFRVKT